MEMIFRWPSALPWDLIDSFGELANLLFGRAVTDSVFADITPCV